MSRVAALFLIGAVVVAYAQSGAEKAVQLALDGRCPEAMPLLKEAMGVVSDSDLKRKVGKGGVRCAMLMNQENTATLFSTGCSRSFRAIRIFSFWPCTFIRIWPS
jgi:hypothetical protein